jgi:outer membrane protein assembly factor BamB
MKKRRLFGIRNGQVGHSVGIHISILLLILLLIPSVPAQDMMYRYDAGHTGDYSPVAGVTGNNISLLWNRTMENTAWGRSVPAVADGTIYITNTVGSFYALNATTGSEQWNSSILIQQSSPAVVNGTVYVGSEDGNVYALNTFNGETVWIYRTDGSIISSPILVNRTVYITSNNNQGNAAPKNILYALNARTGEQIWNFTIEGYSDSTPAATDTTVIIRGNGGRVYAVTADTGAKIWKTTIGSGSGYAFTPSPLIKTGIVYVGSNEGNNIERALTFNIYALNETTGIKIWNFSTSGHLSSEPALSRNILYINSDTHVYALNATTGSVLWSTNPTSTVIVANDALYLCNYGNLRVIDPTNGTLLWSLSLPVENFLWKSTSTTIDDGRFYEVNYGSNAGNPAGGPSIDKITIYTLDLNAGSSGVPLQPVTPTPTFIRPKEGTSEPFLPTQMIVAVLGIVLLAAVAIVLVFRQRRQH